MIEKHETVALRCLHTLSFHSLSVTGDGKFKSVSDLAREIGLDVSFAARLLRLTLLAPDIIESILMGEEPSGLSLTMLTKQLPVVWSEQRAILGFARAGCSGKTP